MPMRARGGNRFAFVLPVCMHGQHMGMQSTQHVRGETVPARRVTAGPCQGMGRGTRPGPLAGERGRDRRPLSGAWAGSGTR